MRPVEHIYMPTPPNPVCDFCCGPSPSRFFRRSDFGDVVSASETPTDSMRLVDADGIWLACDECVTAAQAGKDALVERVLMAYPHRRAHLEELYSRILHTLDVDHPHPTSELTHSH